jgi:hypothetical protein
MLEEKRVRRKVTYTPASADYYQSWLILDGCDGTVIFISNENACNREVLGPAKFRMQC